MPALALSHGQILRLLDELGFRQGVPESTFNHYIKSLRKLGIPFEVGKGQTKGRSPVTYDFEEIMELAVALLLRVYGILPDAVVTAFRDFRNELRPIYRQAYLDTLSRTFPQAQLSEAHGDQTDVNGLFLDLNIQYSAGSMINFGPPRALSPLQALRIYADCPTPARSYLPLDLTPVVEMIVANTGNAPLNRRSRGRH